MWMIDEPLFDAGFAETFVSDSPSDIVNLLFVSQRRRGIDRRGAPRREVARGNADQPEDRRGRDADLPGKRWLPEKSEHLVALDREEACSGHEQSRDDDPEKSPDEGVDQAL